MVIAAKRKKCYAQLEPAKKKICSNSKLSKGQVPCQAVHHKLMTADEIPSELECLEKLVQVLIAWHIVFEKIIVMPKANNEKSKGPFVIYL